MWADKADSDINIRWTKEFWAALRPYLADAAYVNYLGQIEEEGIRVAYGKKYDRLAELKAQYDPTNFFCMNQNIKPSRAASIAGGAGER
jgi:FAD/FMN-containing dehydrogenase